MVKPVRNYLREMVKVQKTKIQGSPRKKVEEVKTRMELSEIENSSSVLPEKRLEFKLGKNLVNEDIKSKEVNDGKDVNLQRKSLTLEGDQSEKKIKDFADNNIDKIQQPDNDVTTVTPVFSTINNSLSPDVGTDEQIKHSSEKDYNKMIQDSTKSSIQDKITKSSEISATNLLAMQNELPNCSTETNDEDYQRSEPMMVDNDMITSSGNLCEQQSQIDRNSTTLNSENNSNVPMQDMEHIPSIPANTSNTPMQDIETIPSTPSYKSEIPLQDIENTPSTSTPSTMIHSTCTTTPFDVTSSRSTGSGVRLPSCSQSPPKPTISLCQPSMQITSVIDTHSHFHGQPFSHPHILVPGSFNAFNAPPSMSTPTPPTSNPPTPTPSTPKPSAPPPPTPTPPTPTPPTPTPSTPKPSAPTPSTPTPTPSTTTPTPSTPTPSTPTPTPSTPKPPTPNLPTVTPTPSTSTPSIPTPPTPTPTPSTPNPPTPTPPTPTPTPSTPNPPTHSPLISSNQSTAQTVCGKTTISPSKTYVVAQETATPTPITNTTTTRPSTVIPTALTAPATPSVPSLPNTSSPDSSPSLLCMEIMEDFNSNIPVKSNLTVDPRHPQLSSQTDLEIKPNSPAFSCSTSTSSTTPFQSSTSIVPTAHLVHEVPVTSNSPHPANAVSVDKVSSIDASPPMKVVDVDYASGTSNMPTNIPVNDCEVLKQEDSIEGTRDTDVSHTLKGDNEFSLGDKVTDSDVLMCDVVTKGNNQDLVNNDETEKQKKQDAAATLATLCEAFSTPKGNPENISNESTKLDKDLTVTIPADISLTSQVEKTSPKSSKSVELEHCTTSNDEATTKPSHNTTNEKHSDNNKKRKEESMTIKCFKRFEFLHTGEKLFKCISQQSSQCFDTRIAAQFHTKSHGFKLDQKVALDQRSISQRLHLFCVYCDFKTASNRWFDLLRHNRELHGKQITTDANLKGPPNSVNSSRRGCYLCGLTFDTSANLHDHMDYHYNSRYKCKYCGIVLSSWKHVQKHVSSECEQASLPQTDDSVIYLGCPFCPLVFHKKNMRMVHALSHSDTGLTCLFCQDDIPFEVWRHLRRHYQNRHAAKMNENLTLVNPPLRPQTPFCHLCSMDFRHAEDFNNHILKVHDFVPYICIACEYCDKTFRTQKLADKHVKKIHQQDLRCSKCVYIAQTVEQRKRHEANEHKEETHLCSECEKTFFTFVDLKQHMVRHATNSIFPCRMCGLEMNSATELRRHKSYEHSNVGHNTSGKKTPKPSPKVKIKPGKPGKTDVVSIVAPNEDTTCPECLYKCYSSKALVKHLLRVHGKLPSAHPGGGKEIDSQDAVILAAKKRLASSEKKLKGHKGHKRGPKGVKSSKNIDQSNYQSYNRSNRLASVRSPVKLPGILNDPLPPPSPNKESQPSSNETPAFDPSTLKRSFGCARIRSYELYLKKKMTKENNITISASIGDSNPIGRPKLRKKVTEVDIDHCYSLPNLMPQLQDVRVPLGVYKTWITNLGQRKRSDSDDTTSVGISNDELDESLDEHGNPTNPFKRLKLDESINTTGDGDNDKDLESDYLRSNNTSIGDDEDFKALLETMETSPQRSVIALANQLLKTPTKKQSSRLLDGEVSSSADVAVPLTSTGVLSLGGALSASDSIDIDSDIINQILRDVEVESANIEDSVVTHHQQGPKEDQPTSIVETAVSLGEQNVELPSNSVTSASSPTIAELGASKNIDVGVSSALTSTTPAPRHVTSAPVMSSSVTSTPVNTHSNPPTSPLPQPITSCIPPSNFITSSTYSPLSTSNVVNSQAYTDNLVASTSAMTCISSTNTVKTNTSPVQFPPQQTELMSTSDIIEFNELADRLLQPQSSIPTAVSANSNPTTTSLTNTIVNSDSIHLPNQTKDAINDPSIKSVSVQQAPISSSTTSTQLSISSSPYYQSPSPIHTTTDNSIASSITPSITGSQMNTLPMSQLSSVRNIEEVNDLTSLKDSQEIPQSCTQVNRNPTLNIKPISTSTPIKQNNTSIVPQSNKKQLQDSSSSQTSTTIPSMITTSSIRTSQMLSSQLTKPKQHTSIKSLQTIPTSQYLVSTTSLKPHLNVVPCSTSPANLYSNKPLSSPLLGNTDKTSIDTSLSVKYSNKIVPMIKSHSTITPCKPAQSSIVSYRPTTNIQPAYASKTAANTSKTHYNPGCSASTLSLPTRVNPSQAIRSITLNPTIRVIPNTTPTIPSVQRKIFTAPITDQARLGSTPPVGSVPSVTTTFTPIKNQFVVSSNSQIRTRPIILQRGNIMPSDNSQISSSNSTPPTPSSTPSSSPS